MQESLRRNGVALALIVNNSVQNVVLGCNLKSDRIIPVDSKANHSTSDLKVIQVYAPTTDDEEAGI